MMTAATCLMSNGQINQSFYLNHNAKCKFFGKFSSELLNVKSNK